LATRSAVTFWRGPHAPAELIVTVLEADDEDPATLEYMLPGERPADGERYQLDDAYGGLPGGTIANQGRQVAPAECVAEQPAARRNGSVVEPGVPVAEACVDVGCADRAQLITGLGNDRRRIAVDARRERCLPHLVGDAQQLAPPPQVRKRRCIVGGVDDGDHACGKTPDIGAAADGGERTVGVEDCLWRHGIRCSAGLDELADRREDAAVDRVGEMLWA
jgi:hypothetical protein